MAEIPTAAQARVLLFLEESGPCFGNVTPAPISTWEATERRGWAVCDPVSDLWKLTPLGRTMLNRWKERDVEKINLTVVVSGQGTTVKVVAEDLISTVIKRALLASGNVNRGPAPWELRTTDGELLEHRVRLKAYGLTSNMTLYLSPSVGWGAA